MPSSALSLSASWWARHIGGAPPWALHVEGGVAVLQVGADAIPVALADLVAVESSRWLLWEAITWPGLPGRLLGLRRGQAADVRAAARQELAAREEQAGRVADLHVLAAAVVSWWLRVQGELGQRRWVTRDRVAEWLDTRPDADRLTELLAANELAGEVGKLEPVFWEAGGGYEEGRLVELAFRHNQSVLEVEPTRLAEFFGSVEQTPLTREQTEAVLTFDNRVLVVAAAGSGKTSTMVARAAYAVREDLVHAERILMLTFNTAAAKELKDRVQTRLGKRVPIRTSTFHAFGLDVIGAATGRKPAVSPEVLEAGGVALVERLVRNLCADDPSYAADWTLFRLVFARELPPFGADLDPAAPGLATLDGKTVRSQEERMIADWLYVNGVDYRYEPDYEFDTADGEHRQYEPDFYYPNLGLYHEHFALDRNGVPPAHFHGYAEGVRWKRQLHQDCGTALFETTSAGIRDGSDFTRLAAELTSRGAVLDPCPRPVKEREAVTADRGAYGLLRAFLAHVKGSRLTDADLHARARVGKASPIRAELFLRVFCPLRAAWDRRLRSSGTVDFDDMVLQAADLVRNGGWSSPYELVLVDEFQDTSAARADLAAALVAAPHRYLFAVGDDWQSINRFAGADVSVMTRFADRFGPGVVTLRLGETFRSPQSLCDVAGRFVSRNPAQIDKTVVSHRPDRPPTIRAVALRGHEARVQAVRLHLDTLEAAAADNAADRTDPAGVGLRRANTGGRSVLVLSRYRKTRDEFRDALGSPARWPHLAIIHDTMHASKGGEADHVVIPGLDRGGFPCEIEDDPLLGIALPTADLFPFADERRLFYVALTRARRDVLLLTVEGQESMFVEELVGDGLVLVDADGKPVRFIYCPVCGARMVLRTGRHGLFWGCRRYRAGCRGSRSSADSPLRPSGRPGTWPA